MTAIDAVELTRRLVAFDTRNPPGHEEECAAYLAELLDEHGFDIERHAFAEGRTSLVACIGDAHAGERLCFTGHIDVVPLGAKSWSADPFAGEVADGKLFGRGASDMKSGVAAFVAAVIAERRHLEQGPGAALVITAGEETGCEGARYLVEREAIGTARAMIVAEPTSNYPLLGHKGALWLRAVSTGVTAHGSMPERGVNAAFKAGHALCRLEDFGFNEAPHEVMGSPTLNVGTVKGGMNINSVPDRTEIDIDIRTVPGVDHERLKDGLLTYLSPEVAEIDPIVDLQGVWTESSTAFVRDVYGIAREMLNEEPEPRSATYFTDASILTPAYGNVPTVVLGPGEAAMAHQTDEYCFVERIPEAVDIYRRLIRLG